MFTIKKYRCSFLPMLFSCGASSIAPNVTAYREPGEAAELGTITHSRLCNYIKKGEIPEEFESKEASILFNLGLKMWREFAPEFPNPICEEEITAVISSYAEVAGHVDLISIVVNVARILDWKTGRKDSDYREQMRGYCACVLDMFPDLESATATIAWIRTGEIERYTMERGQLEDWRCQVIKAIKDNTEAAGPYCDYCQRSHECKSRNAIVQQSIAELMSLENVENSLALMAPDAIIATLHKAKMVSRCADVVQSAIRKHLETVGQIEGEKQVLGLSEESRRECETLKAWPILSEYLSDEELASCVKVSLSEVEDVISSKESRGKKKQAIERFRDRLNAVDAIKLTTIRKIQERRK